MGELLKKDPFFSRWDGISNMKLSQKFSDYIASEDDISILREISEYARVNLNYHLNPEFIDRLNDSRLSSVIQEVSDIKESLKTTTVEESDEMTETTVTEIDDQAEFEF